MEMKAGRELDTLVAEKVMGWTRRRVRLGIGGTPGSFETDALVNGDRIHAIDPKDQPYNASAAPHYSADIAAAWEVVEKLTQNREPHFELSRGRDGWHAEFDLDRPFNRAVAKAETAPHAICLAALKAAGEEA